MTRIITVTPNPALDKNYVVPGFVVGEVQRPQSFLTSPGGKGINVARVLKTLGADVVATGFLGGPIGRAIQEGLEAEQIPSDFIDISPEETRLAIVILDPVSGEQTVLNELGPNLGRTHQEALIENLEKLTSQGDWIVLSGSLPPGFPSDTYSKIVEFAKLIGAKTLLDTSGEAFKLGLAAKPDVAKPNANELSEARIVINNWEADSAGAVRKLRETYGLGIGVVTGGAKGAVICDGDGVFRATLPPLENMVSAVGSGDSFAAGLVYSLSHDPSGGIEAALRLASACGAANTLSAGAGYATKGQIDEVSGRIVIEKVA